MSKTHWLIFVSLAALSSGFVWHYAPVLGTKLPPAVRTRICDTVADVQNRFGIVREGFAEHLGNATPKPAKPTEDEDTADVVVQDVVPAQTQSVVTQTPPVVTQKQDVAAIQQPKSAAQPTPAVQPKPAVQKETPQFGKEESPYDKGIVRIGPSSSSGATWGVLSHVTPVESLDGKVIGNVAGGRFFLIERREKVDRTLMLIGNFTPKKLPQTVRVAAKDVICFTQSPDDLSENQKNSLRNYYQLNGEAETLKSQLLVKESKKNPFAVEAAKALSELRAKEAAASNANDADSNRNATYDIAPLAEKVRSLNKKAKEWKEANASKLSDPEKDPAYLKIIKERNKYGEAIPGLAF